MQDKQLKELVRAIKKRDWSVANESFLGLMQDKVNARLSEERKRVYESKVPVSRSWTASITYEDGREITTTIHGSNATEAENNYKREHKNVKRVVARSEQR